MIPVEYHPDALEELAESVRYYESVQSGLGQRFHRLIEQLESEIREHPETGFLHDSETRMRLVRKFPYGVIFKNYTDRVLIVAVAHLSRVPGYWHKRVPQVTGEESME